MTLENQQQPHQVLLVEDNPADARLLMFLFEMAGFKGKIHWVKDGEEALHYAFKESTYEAAPTPDLVILDLNLPKVNGLDVLKSLRSKEGTREVPVIILTTSSSDEDKVRSVPLNAKSFMTKPKDLPKFEGLVKQILTSHLIRAV